MGFPSPCRMVRWINSSLLCCPRAPGSAVEAYHRIRGDQDCPACPALAPLAVCLVALVALDVFVDGLSDDVGQVAILFFRDLFQLASTLRVEAQAVVFGDHVFLPRGYR